MRLDVGVRVHLHTPFRKGDIAAAAHAARFVPFCVENRYRTSRAIVQLRETHNMS